MEYVDCFKRGKLVKSIVEEWYERIRLRGKTKNHSSLERRMCMCGFLPATIEPEEAHGGPSGTLLTTN